MQMQGPPGGFAVPGAPASQAHPGGFQSQGPPPPQSRSAGPPTGNFQRPPGGPARPAPVPQRGPPPARPQQMAPVPKQTAEPMIAPPPSRGGGRPLPPMSDVTSAIDYQGIVNKL